MSKEHFLSDHEKDPRSVSAPRRDATVIPIRNTDESVEFSADLPFRLLVESVRDYAIFLLDPEGHILTWNAGAQQIKGYSKDEILGKHFSIFYLPEAIKSEWPKQELALAE